MGPEMPERGSKTSTVRVLWATSGIFSARSNWSPFAIGDHGRNLVISLWPGDKATHGGIAAYPAPKNPSVNIRWKSFRLHFLGESRRHSPHWLFSKGPNYQRGVLLISAGAIEGHFEVKTPRGGKVTKGVLFMHDSAPAHRALATPQKMAYLGFLCLDHPTYSPDLAPSDYHLFPGLKKTIKSSTFFVRRGGHCCRGDLVGRTKFWIFFWVACKS